MDFREATSKSPLIKEMDATYKILPIHLHFEKDILK